MYLFRFLSLVNTQNLFKFKFHFLKWLKIFFLCCFCSCSSLAYAETNDLLSLSGTKKQKNSHAWQKILRNGLSVSMVTGGVSSTNLRMAGEIANIVDGHGKQIKLRVLPIIGKGGVQNLLDVLYLKGIDMGLIQQGQLSYVQKRNPTFFKNIKSRLRYISKLHNAEFHLIASKRFESIYQLTGKKIAMDLRFSSTDLMARTVFEKLDMTIVPVNESFASGLDQLLKRKVSAIAVLGGAPIEGITEKSLRENFHILPISVKTVGLKAYEKLTAEFLPTRIEHKHYPKWISKGQAIPSIASGVILVVYNWKPQTQRYKKISVFIEKFYDSFDGYLSPILHPKWREVNLHAEIAGLKRFAPAERWLKIRQNEVGRKTYARE